MNIYDLIRLAEGAEEIDRLRRQVETARSALKSVSDGARGKAPDALRAYEKECISALSELDRLGKPVLKHPQKR